MTAARRQDCRLYLVTPGGLHTEAALAAFAGDLARALDAADVACVLLRSADLNDWQARTAAERLRPIAQRRDVAFLVESSAELAKATGSDGVHLAEGEAAVGHARRVIGPEAIVGVACGGSRDAAMLAADAGADYVAFEAPREELVELLSWWQEIMALPCVAMGEIGLDDAAELVDAGADFLAAGSAVWAHPDGPDAAVRHFAALLGSPG